MWDTCKKDPGIEITEHATVAKQTIASLGTVIGLPPVRNCNRSFEIKIEVNRGSVHIGWVNEAVFRSFPKKAIPRGIGCCLGSYAMDSLEGSLGENNKWRPYYKKKLKANDFVTTTLDPINGTIEYWVNGVSLGIAFKGLDVSQKYFPAVSLRYKKTKISCNFRGPFKFEGIGSLGISAFSSKEMVDFEKNSEMNYDYNNENAPILKLKIFSYLPEKNLSRTMRASRLLYCVGKDDSLWKEKVAQSFYIKLDHIPLSNYGEIVSQCKSEGVKEISLTSSLMMKEHKKKSDWANGRYSPKIKNFYFPSFPSSVRFDSEICLISYDNIMKFYDTQTLEEIGGDLKTIENYANINCQQFDENKLVFGDSDGYFSIYNLNNGKRIWRTLSHQGGLESIEFNSENMLLCSGWTRHVSWWDSEVETKTLDIPNCHTEALCVTKYVKGQEDLIITASYDKTIKLFDLRSSECTATIDFSKSGIPACLDFSIDGNSFAAGSSNGGISIFDMREIGDCYSNILLNINSHRSTVTSLFYDGYRLISGGYDQKVIGWDTEINERNFTIKPGNKVICMYFDGTRLGVGLDSKKLAWYDLSQSPVKQYTSMREVYAKRI